MAQDRELRELARGASFTASDEEVDQAIAEAADELGKTEEEVRDNVAYIMDSTFEEEGVSTSFNEMVSGAALEDDIGSTGDPRLEALEMYKLRQKL
jgi:predicted transcriptional regulator